jgi:hypothetical protein
MTGQKKSNQGGRYYAERRARRLARKRSQNLFSIAPDERGQEDNIVATQCSAMTIAGVRCRHLTNDASGLCPAHRNQVPAQPASTRANRPAAANQRQNRRPAQTPPAPTPTTSWWQRNGWNVVATLLIVAATLLIILTALALFDRFSGQQATNQPVVVIQPTEAPRDIVMPPTPAAPVIVQPTSRPATCGSGWNADETRDLQPGQAVLGDVEVAGVVRYDVGGSGEGTVVINLSSKPVPVFAQWGAGLQCSTDLRKLVNGEFRSGCGSVCETVRLVSVTDQGISEKIYSAPIP